MAVDDFILAQAHREVRLTGQPFVRLNMFVVAWPKGSYKEKAGNLTPLITDGLG
jgi:hypothetical protein